MCKQQAQVSTSIFYAWKMFRLWIFLQKSYSFSVVLFSLFYIYVLSILCLWYNITKILCFSSVVGRLATFIVRKTRWRQHQQKKISPFLHGEVKLKTIFGGVSIGVLEVYIYLDKKLNPDIHYSIYSVLRIRIFVYLLILISSRQLASQYGTRRWG